MNHHITSQLARERTADLLRERRLRDKAARAAKVMPVQKVARKRVHLPLIARGVANFEDYYRKGQR
jgi:hypothetical protein